MCINCGKHKNSNSCYQNCPYLVPPGRLRKKDSYHALVGQEGYKNSIDSNQEVHVFLLGCISSISVSFNATFPTLNLNSTEWEIDSRCTKHFAFDQTAFTSYETISPTILDLGASSTTTILGQEVSH